MKLTLENIKIINNKIYDSDGKYRGEIIYKYIRGSQLYHTNIETSDEDNGGVYIMPNDSILGLGLDYQSEIKDKTGDKVMWELGRFLGLVLSSNPTVLEALFVPDDMVIYENSIMKEIRSHRNEFVTKQCFSPFGGYAVSQIKKAQGINKKIRWDMEDVQRKQPIDFCYTFNDKQGTEPILNWLEDRGLKQIYCGLNHLPNMNQMYGVFYDWGQHLHMEYKTKEEFIEAYNKVTDEELGHNLFWKKINSLMEYYNCYKNNCKISKFYDGYDMIKPSGYHGIQKEDGTSTYIHLDSILKGDIRICNLQFNEDGYQTHCRQYKEYVEWKEKRNKARYESNMEGEKSGDPDMKYDVKNMYHSFRLIAMAKEIAEGKGVILDRTGIDRDFIIDVRNRKFGYSELIKKMIVLKDEMDEAIKNSTIKDEIDSNFVNDILIKARHKYLLNDTL